MEAVFDLKIENNDLVFGNDGEPEYLQDASAISQDVVHRVKETGLVKKLVGARGAEKTETLQKIKIAVEEDERVKPGSGIVTQIDDEKTQITAKTLDGQTLSPEL